MKNATRAAVSLGFVAAAIPLLCAASSSEGARGLAKLPPASRRPVIAQLAKLTASDGQTLNHFGASVAISGDVIAVGAYDAGTSGVVYVFVRPADGWHDMTETAKLTASDNHQDELGGDVAIAGAILYQLTPHQNRGKMASA